MVRIAWANQSAWRATQNGVKIDVIKEDMRASVSPALQGKIANMGYQVRVPLVLLHHLKVVWDAYFAFCMSYYYLIDSTSRSLCTLTFMIFIEYWFEFLNVYWLSGGSLKAINNVPSFMKLASRQFWILLNFLCIPNTESLFYGVREQADIFPVNIFPSFEEKKEVCTVSSVRTLILRVHREIILKFLKSTWKCKVNHSVCSPQLM